MSELQRNILVILILSIYLTLIREVLCKQLISLYKEEITLIGGEQG